MLEKEGKYDFFEITNFKHPALYAPESPVCVATYYPKFQPNSARISLSKHHFLHLEHTLQVCKRRVIFQLIWVGTIVSTYYPKFQLNSARISLSKHYFLHSSK